MKIINNNLRMKKILFELHKFPFMILFYLFSLKILKDTNMNKYKLIIQIIFLIQIITHTMQLFTKNFQCTPTDGPLWANNIVLTFGVIYFSIFLHCFYKKKNILTIYTLLISLYMILSHIITIDPINKTFIVNGIKADIFDKKSYLIFLSNKFHEKKLRKKIMELQKKIGNKTIIDAGAYNGDTSIFMAKHSKNQNIYAIEPSQRNINFIKKIKEQNNLKNLHPYRYLLSNKHNIYETKNEDLPNAQYKLVENNKCNDCIKSVTLDYLVETGEIKGEIGILHFDVEGMELEVLQGSINTTKKYKPYIIVETLGKNEKKNKLVDNLLRSLNYTSETINESCNVIDIFDKDKCRNHIYVHKSNK
jgi:FkbM family methyltransferase